MGFTSDLVNADSDVRHRVKVTLTNGESGTKRLPNLPGDDYLMNKGDLWTISFRTHLDFTSCVMKSDIQSIAIKQGGNDDWNIKTIVTFVGSGDDYELATTDFNVNRWIDSDGDESHRLFELNLVL